MEVLGAIEDEAGAGAGPGGGRVGGARAQATCASGGPAIGERAVPKGTQELKRVAAPLTGRQNAVSLQPLPHRRFDIVGAVQRISRGAGFIVELDNFLDCSNHFRAEVEGHADRADVI